MGTITRAAAIDTQLEQAEEVRSPQAPVPKARAKRALAQPPVTHHEKRRPRQAQSRVPGQPVLVPAADFALVECMRSSRGVPFFICAPAKTGRSSLALDYAQRVHSLDEVLWMDGTTDGFAEALGAGTMLEHLEQQIASGLSRFRLIVFDDLPFLGERAASIFSDWIDDIIEAQVEVLVITTPHEDCLADYQSDRLLIEGNRLVASQKWPKQRMTDALNSFFDAPLPPELHSLAALMLLMGRGIVDNLRELGYQIPAGLHARLRQHCPFIVIDEAAGSFDATACPVMPLKQRLVALVNGAARTGEDGGMSVLERSFERLTQLSIYLFERMEGERSQLLLELAGSLLAYDDAGYPLAAAAAAAVCEAQEEQAGQMAQETRGAQVAQETHGAQEAQGAYVAQAAYSTLVPSEQPATYPSVRVPSFMPRPASPLAAQTAPLVIRMFGDFEIHRGNVRIESTHLHRRKVREMLVHLALNLGRPLTRETLMERLWPDKDLPHAKDNFYTTWSRLNRALADGPGMSCYLSNGRGLCRLETSIVTTDVHEFEQLSRAVLFEQGSTEQRIDAMYRLEQMYRGDILSGCLIDPFVQAAQARYRSILVDVMLEASKLFSELGNDTNAVWFARKAYDIDPKREDVYRILMAMQDRAGQRTSALRTYFDCKRFLSEELGIMPSQKTTALYQDLVLDRR
jgi:DNA-binding SARP family transcriptional activator